MSDTSLDIVIRTTTELAGAQQAAVALEMQIGKAKALGKDYSALQEQLDRVNASLKNVSPELNKLTEDENEAGKAAEFVHRNHRMFHKLLETMPPVIGQVGGGMLTMLKGPLGPAVALAIAVEKIREKLKEYNEELDKIPEEELAAHADSIKKLKEAWDIAQKGIGDYYAAMATVGGEKDPIKKQLENIKAISDATLDAHKKEIESLGKVEVAYLKAHGGTPGEIAAAEERTRKVVEADESKKEFSHGVGGLQAEQEARLKENGRLQAEANAKMKEAAGAKEALSRQQEELKKAREALDPSSPAGKESAQKMSEAQAELESAKNLPNFISQGTPGVYSDVSADNRTRVAEAKTKVEQLESERQAALQRIGQLEADEHIKTQKAAEAETYSKSAQDRSVTNQGRLRDLPGEIDQAKNVQGINDRAREKADIFNTIDEKTGKSIGEMGKEIGETGERTMKTVDLIITHQRTLQQVLYGYETRIAQLEVANARAEANRNYQ